MRTERWLGVQGCFEDDPDAATIILGGRYISLVKLAFETQYDRSHLSRVINDRVAPSVACAQKVAKALGLHGGVDELMSLIQARFSRKSA